MYHFEDFKSFAKASIDLSKPFTVLIGKNGSGKSNTIEGLELLAQLAHGRPLNEIADVGRGTGIFEVRGGLQGCTRLTKSSFLLGFAVELKSGSICRYDLRIQTVPKTRIASEHLALVTSDGRKRTFISNLREPQKTAHGVAHYRVHDVYRGEKRTVALPSDRSALSQFEGLQEPSEENPQLTHPGINQIISSLRTNLRMFFAFDPNPKTMRNYERIGDDILSRNGSNISAVLYSLKKGGARGKEALSRILSCIQQLPEEPFTGFDFVTTDLNDVVFGLKVAQGNQLIDARALSDGTLRCLSVLTALETVAESSHVIIEEFDNGLHPSRVGVLTQSIWDCARRRKLKVLVTTHNPATLDALTEEQLAGVVLCFWDKKQKASRLLPLLELPRADVLLERGHLGDLVTNRILEQHLAPGFEEHRKQKATDWLKALP